MIAFIWGTRVVKFTERGSTIGVVRDWEEGAKRSDCLMGTKSHTGMMKSSGDMDSGGGGTWCHWTVHLKIV